MMRTVRFAVGLLAAVACTCSWAAGVLKLSSAELTLEPAQAQATARELYVENVGDTPLYLNIEQHLLTNPGESPEHLVPVAEVARPTLLVSPARLTLAPNQKYRMGLKELAVPEQTQVWRITFRPKEQIVVDATQDEGAPAPLFVNVGYGVVIYQRAVRAE
ncbi:MULTISPECIES: hypothetical protein [Burkholderia]|uniref:hypothetical protein n=1 Tax=Burkholderia TaxID=32008 RepID=UPI000B79B8B6|nr:MULTISPECIES: hypothetical protein [Burkholderia]MBY4726159.1 hypothetical protein [Burkholderia contaminans]MCI3967933.1 hypothetical protein [Burkholderia sp. HI4860]MDN7791777.1 hypothetical protein [Burkholderia contaminans]OXI97636.1 hypothetical protein CFB48_19355 [Burkholderia sp. AU33647]